MTRASAKTKQLSLPTCDGFEPVEMGLCEVDGVGGNKRVEPMKQKSRSSSCAPPTSALHERLRAATHGTSLVVKQPPLPRQVD